MKKDIDFALQVAKKTAYLMTMQEHRGICFDKEEGLRIAELIKVEMDEIEARVEPLLPPVPMTKGELDKHRVPTIRFKADKKATHGVALSSAMLAKYGEDNFYKDEEDHWCFVPLKCRVRDIPDTYHMKTTRPFKLKDQMELKKYLMEEHGWQPLHWNYQKDAKGKDIRDPITKQKIETTPKFHDKGEMCENLDLLGEDINWLKDVVRWLSIKHKRSLLLGDDGEKGLCNHWRLSEDGRLPAGASGIANSWRMKHITVANIPRVSSVYGKEIRGLFTCPPDKVMVGFDASSLEDRIKGHYTSYFDGGAYAREILADGFDIHRKMGLIWGTMKDENDKVGRQATKPAVYALAYGCMPNTLSRILKCDLHSAKEYHEAYWEYNSAWKAVNVRLEEQWEARKKQGVICPVSGAFLHIKSKNILGSWLIQHTGGFAMDLAGCFMDMYLGGVVFNEEGAPCYKYKGHYAARVVYYHDEYLFECDPEIAEDVLALGIKSIQEAGKYLNLNVNLEAEGHIGKSWGDVH